MNCRWRSLDLWTDATEKERRRLLVTMLGAKGERRIVSVRPRAPFRAVFQAATTKEGSGVVLVQQSQKGEEPLPDRREALDPLCSWWRRPVSR